MKDVQRKMVSHSVDETMKLAAMIGKNIRGGEIIELIGDLGSGKTVLVQGLVKGMGSSDVVHSPSFTLTNQYKTDRFRVYHYDFYRLSEPGIVQNEMSELLGDPEAVIVIEWPGIVEHSLPDKRLTITIHATDEANRTFDFDCPKNLSYLVPINT